MLEGLTWVTIKPLLLRLLPGAAAAIAIVGATSWIDHEGYRRAMAGRDAADMKLLGAVMTELRSSEQRLTEHINGIATDYQSQRDTLSRTGSALQPIILKEAAREPRLSDPASGLTPGLLGAVNRARAAGACAATAAGGIACALPAVVANPGNDNR